MMFSAHRISRIVITNNFCTNETVRKLQAWGSGLFSKFKKSKLQNSKFIATMVLSITF